MIKGFSNDNAPSKKATNLDHIKLHPLRGSLFSASKNKLLYPVMNHRIINKVCNIQAKNCTSADLYTIDSQVVQH